MAITLRQKGEAALYAKAGQAIGKQKAAEKAQATAERQQQQAIAISERQRAEQAARDWELQKMQMRSQQDFQQELAERQLDFEKFNRAKSWDVEKMEIASRMDFERKEKQRAQRLDEIDTGLRQLDKEVESGRLTEAQVAPHKFKLEMEKYGYEAPVSSLWNRGQENILSLLGDSDADPTGLTGANPLGLDITPPELIDTLPTEELQLETEQKVRVISPDGEEETIKLSDWSVYKERGYILADILELRTRGAGLDAYSPTEMAGFGTFK